MASSWCARQARASLMSLLLVDSVFQLRCWCWDLSAILQWECKKRPESVRCLWRQISEGSVDQWRFRNDSGWMHFALVTKCCFKGSLKSSVDHKQWQEFTRWTSTINTGRLRRLPVAQVRPARTQPTDITDSVVVITDYHTNTSNSDPNKVKMSI